MEKTIILILAFAVSIITAINTSTLKPSTWICDEPPPPVDPETCCDFPNIFNDSIVDKCERDHAGKSAGDMMTDSCVIECMFNMSLKNMKLDNNRMIDLVTKKIDSKSQWYNTALNALKTCFTEIQNEDIDEIVQNFKEDMAAQTKKIIKFCHPIPVMFLDCFNLELFKACPKEKFIIDSSACSALKNYTIVCNDW